MNGNLPVESFVPSTGFVRLAKVRLNATEMIAANQPAGLGHIIIPAQGPNTVVALVGTWIVTISVGSVAFNFSPNWTMNWRGAGGFGAGTNIAGPLAPSIATANRVFFCAATPTQFTNGLLQTTTDFVNRAVVLTGNVPALANGTNGIMHVSGSYIVLPVGV